MEWSGSTHDVTVIGSRGGFEERFVGWQRRRRASTPIFGGLWRPPRSAAAYADATWARRYAPLPTHIGFPITLPSRCLGQPRFKLPRLSMRASRVSR